MSDKISTRFGPAAESLRALKAEGHAPFDVAFIDADKPASTHSHQNLHCGWLTWFRSQSYATYVKLLLDFELLAPDGIILADNTLYKVRA